MRCEEEKNEHGLSFTCCHLRRHYSISLITLIIIFLKSVNTFLSSFSETWRWALLCHTEHFLCRAIPRTPTPVSDPGLLSLMLQAREADDAACPHCAYPVSVGRRGALSKAHSFLVQGFHDTELGAQLCGRWCGWYWHLFACLLVLRGALDR